MKKKFAIIDGNAIIHRAYHAIPPLTAKDGTMINAVYGFSSILLKVMSDLKPDYLAVSFDVAGGTFRDDVYEDYKGTREKSDQDLYDQIPLVHEIVEAFNIPIFEQKGFEADDVIATVVEKVKKEGVHSIIVTGDMDLLQLVDDDVSVYSMRRGFSDIVMYDEEEVKKKYGFGPDHVIDYKSLKGDTSDNIPGVAGVGDKTAKLLIDQVGGLEEIYKQLKIDDSKLRTSFKPGVIKKLQIGEKDAFMSEELATIMRDVPGVKANLKDAVLREFNMDEVVSLFKKFEFYSLIKRIPGYQGPSVTKSKIGGTNMPATRFTIIEGQNFKEFEDMMDGVERFACAEVLDGAEALDSELIGLTFVIPGKSYYVVLDKVSGVQKKKTFKLFENIKTTVVGHDLKQLVKALQIQGVEVTAKLFDVMIGSYLLNSSTRAHDLKAIVLRELGDELPNASDQSSLFGVDPSVVAKELRLVLEVQKKYAKKLKDEEAFGLFEKIEMRLIPVLAEIEINGIAVDAEMLKILSIDVAKAIDKVTKKIYKESKGEFNVASSTQLREILFEKLELPTQGIKKGKTGYSTAASELEKLHGMHPIIEMVEQFRELEKLRNTYIDVLPTLVNKKTGRIHTDFNQAVTTTGRLSSSNPNLQNIPIRTELGREIRKAFIAEQGHTLVAADYSQIELRIVASLAKDKKLIEIFENGEDVHKATAAAINKVPLEEVTKEMRSAAKAVNFGVLYGMGAYGLAMRAGITNFEAKEFIKKYFEEFSGVKKYLDQTLELAKEEGYVETLFGRRRYVPELQSENYQLKNSGERMAINMPVQGTAADVMKMAMIEVAEEIKKKDFKKGEVKLILQVHDELVLEVKNGLEDEVSKLVKDAMENVVKLNVPVDVDVHAGKRWGNLK